MQTSSIYMVIMVLSALVLVSYLFSILNKKTRIPTVLMLLLAGIGIRAAVNAAGWDIDIPRIAIELVGVIGLIMIVLESALDLGYSREKVQLIRNAFLSSLLIMLVSVVGIAWIIHAIIEQSVLSSVVYAIPLSIISSAIVIPSARELTEIKREFLSYESSFSDILGILVFDYVVAREILSIDAIAKLGGGIAFALIASVALSLLLLWVITHTKITVKFFLMLAALLFLYSAGRLLHLPSLIIILVFGLIINNWDQIRGMKARNFVDSHSTLRDVRDLLKSITAETSFLVRTFFFVLFGYSIELGSTLNSTVIIVGSLIIAVLYLVRYLYLRLFLTKHVFPELFYAPRGLVTILLFYRIPQDLQLASFNDGILFYVVLVTSLMMMVGTFFFTPKKALDPHPQASA